MRAIGWVMCGVVAMTPAVAAAGSPVGLSLRIEEGVSEQVEIIGSSPRYIDELDIVATAVTADDQGIDPVIDGGDLSNLNWSGVTYDDEEWRPAGDGSGTFTRQRFYRDAAWMEEPSVMFIFQRNEYGQYLHKPPIVVYAGQDDLWSGFDGGFIRRFSARQVTTGCTAIGDCSAATEHTAQALVQLRQSQFTALAARHISPQTASLEILWTQDLLHLRSIPIERTATADADYDYGFSTGIEVLTPPANGDYYMPGDAITFKMHFLDGEGYPLHDGALPTYSDFLTASTGSGLRYFDLFLNPTLYYALKHREGNLLMSMGGPAQALQVTDNTVPLTDFFLPQTQSAFSAEQGFSAVVTSIPPFAVIFGGLADASLWDLPVSDEVTLTVPTDALPGTYVVTLKARRDYAGEATNTGSVIRIQVGTQEETAWTPTTTGCQSCHSGAAALGNILHGIGDRESCLSGCHVALGNEPDNALDYRVHFVHSRSDRYPADPDDCTTCHVEEPEGDPRGYPGFVYPYE